MMRELGGLYGHSGEHGQGANLTYVPSGWTSAKSLDCGSLAWAKEAILRESELSS